MDKPTLLTSNHLVSEESLDAFIAMLYRIFHCAEVKKTPTLERFKYLYFTDELIHEQFREWHMNDEMMRVFSKDQDRPGNLTHFQKRLSHFMSESSGLLDNDLLPQLAENGFVYQTIQEGDLHKKKQLIECAEKIAWEMTDFNCMNAQMFKQIKDNSLNYLIVWKNNPKFSILTIPNNREKVVILPAQNYQHLLFHTDDLMQIYLQKVYPHRVVEELVPFRLTIDCLYEKNKFLKTVEKHADTISAGLPIFKTYNCLEIAPIKSRDVLDDLLRITHLSAENCYIESSLQQAGDFFKALIANHPRCSYELMYPRLAFNKTHLLVSPNGVFAKIRVADVLFHHPYQPFDEVLDFFETAATDSYVTSISMTIYRIEKTSKLMDSLKLAASLGKKVRVLIELRVTGYEEYHWKIAKDLQAHGIEVCFGSKDFVTHAKMALIKRKTQNGSEFYSHLSTGNYHRRNSKTYCDLSLITSHAGIGNDIDRIFTSIFEDEQLEPLEHVWVSPLSIRTELMKLILNCVGEAKKNKPSSIFIKTKDFTDLELVKALNNAVKWGVQVIVFVRNISFLTPEEQLLTSKIRVISYVGRLLEHHRVYCFKTADQEKIFLGSCNMVKKNIDKRIELIFPIYQKSIQNKIKEEIIENIQKNSNNCWEMDQNGNFQFIRNATKDFQTVLIEKYEKRQSL